MRALGPFLGDVWRLAWPYFWSEEKWSARGLLASMIMMRLMLVGIGVVLNFWNNAFFNSLQDKNLDAFINLLLFWQHTPRGIMPGFFGLATIYILIAVYRIYLTQLLQIRWRRWLTGRFLDEWLADRAYYRISLTTPADAKGTATDNPDQRIAEDLRDFIGDSVIGTKGVLFFGIDLMANIVSLVSYIAILWGLSGSVSVLGVPVPGYMVWIALVYAAVGTVLTHFVGRPLAMLSFRKQQTEADFRFALVRLRENTEGIALYGGEEGEKQGLSRRFGALVVNWRGLMSRYKRLIALQAGYGQVAGVFPLVIAAPRYFAGQIQLGGMMQTVGAFSEVQGSMSWFVDNYADLATWRATVDRLTSFDRAIQSARAASGFGVVAEPTGGERYALHDATISLPNGEALLAHLDLSLEPGRPVAITGRSGSGKSTFFRALAGIWPFGSGQVQRPRGSVLFLPQRPYIPLGTLRRTLTYPDATDAHDEAAVLAALRDVGLDHLAPRLDDEDSWTQRLSGGELQRVAIARALLAKPDWLFLDEATANLDPDAEDEAFAVLRRKLPATTIVSIAHHPVALGRDARHLRFERPPGRLVDLDAQPAAAAD